MKNGKKFVVLLEQKQINTYPQFNFTNTCMIQDTMYTVIMKEANTLSKQIMSIEIKGYVRMEQQEEFEAWEKEQLATEYEIKQVGSMRFRVPKKKDINQGEFINITGNPEYAR